MVCRYSQKIFEHTNIENSSELCYFIRDDIWKIIEWVGVDFLSFIFFWLPPFGCIQKIIRDNFLGEY